MLTVFTTCSNINKFCPPLPLPHPHRENLCFLRAYEVQLTLTKNSINRLVFAMAAKVIREEGHEILSNIYIDFNLQTIYTLKCCASRSRTSNTKQLAPPPPPPPPPPHTKHQPFSSEKKANVREKLKINPYQSFRLPIPVAARSAA